jgi:hypothetical protein
MTPKQHIAHITPPSERIARVVTAAFTAFTAFSASAALAQTARDSLGMGILAYDEFNEQQALPLLMRGLNPVGGPPDSLWSAGLHRLAQFLIDNGRPELGASWLRWALRHAPALRADESFPPNVLAAFQSAKEAVSGWTADPAFASGWEWTPTADPAASARVRYVQADLDALVRVIVLGVGVVPQGGWLDVPPGTHTIEASAPGYATASTTFEALPGVTAVLRPRLADLNPGLLYVASEPWGTVYIDGERAGYTLLAEHPISPGPHNIRIVRPGYVPFDTTIFVQRGERTRLGRIALRTSP